MLVKGFGFAETAWCFGRCLSFGVDMEAAAAHSAAVTHLAQTPLDPGKSLEHFWARRRNPRAHPSPASSPPPCKYPPWCLCFGLLKTFFFKIDFGFLAQTLKCLS